MSPSPQWQPKIVNSLAPAAPPPSQSPPLDVHSPQSSIANDVRTAVIRLIQSPPVDAIRCVEEANRLTITSDLSNLTKAAQTVC